MNDSSDSERRLASGRFAASEAARQTVRALATAFDREKLPVAPLKGVLLVHAHGRDPVTRPISDVDLLVPPERFDDATRLASASGWRFSKEEAGGRQRLLLPAHGGLAVDLHAALFPPHVFDFPTRTVLDQAHSDELLFDAPVRLLALEDLATHLIGHMALTFLFEHRAHHPEDLLFLANETKLNPRILAGRLEETKIDFAARYVLKLGSLKESAFSKAVLENLEHSPLADFLAQAVLKGVPHFPARKGLGLLPPALLHRSPRRGVTEVARGVWRRLAR